MTRPLNPNPTLPRIPRRQGSHGAPPFHPTPDQRAIVKVCAGMSMTLDEICLTVINPHTGKGISRATLKENFADELGAGRANIKALVGRRYVEALNKGAVWAIQAGLRQFYKWKGSGDIIPLEELIPADQSAGDDSALIELEHLLASIRESRTIDGTATELEPATERRADPRLELSRS